ncbi:DUF389 domain-containing protein [Desulfosediminicola sp.]|uniref:DUF389 domain-containing protein n=1 Tax=Desulfosediminicola sp. TaxID=2886825 RepID=UPI003AF1FD5F
MGDQFKRLEELVPGRDNVVAIIITNPDTAFSLLSTGYKTALLHNGFLLVFLLPDLSLEELIKPFENCDRERLVLQEVSSGKPARDILKLIKRVRPIVLGMAMDQVPGESRYLAGSVFDPILQRAPCPVYLIKAPTGWTPSGSTCALIPFEDDKNTHFAIETALSVNPDLTIKAVIVVPPEASPEDLSSRIKTFHEQTDKWQGNPRFKRAVLRGSNVQDTVLAEAEKHDFLLVGASKGIQLVRILFGEVRNTIITESTVPTILLREYQGKAGAALQTGWSFLDALIPTLSKEERVEAYRIIRRGGRPNRDFFAMIALSAGIASLGLVLNSAAVIIGAMLVAPLMSAIIGMGMAIIHGDMAFLRMTFTAALKGSLIAILTGFIFGLVNFHGDPTEQILQRTAPTILDLGVALISGVAAAYAICRKNVSNSLPGVAIAVALVPPLATVGTCLSIAYWGLAWGALKLFLSNLVAIVFASALVFVSFGFRPDFNTTTYAERINVFKKMFISSGLLVVAMLILLVVETTQGVMEASLSDEVEQELVKYITDLGLDAELENWEITTTRSGKARVDLELRSERQLTPNERIALQKRLKADIGKPVLLKIEILPKNNLKNE